MSLKRIIAWILVGSLLLAIMPAMGLAQPRENTPVRVLLRRLNIADRLDVRMDGTYSVGNPGEASMIFTPGSEVAVTLNNGQLYVYYQGLSWNAGSSLCFTRYQRSDGQENGLRLQTGEHLYEGDLYLSAKDTSIQAVLHIALEDYLMGVVPYEMSDSFPLEALKVQAVAARTYAARKMGADGAYDVVDTTNDQVFKGKHPDNATAHQAVTDTRGQLLYYGKELAHCYYSASNGGQTEKASHVWGGRDFPYLIYREDPYDVANPFSTRKSYTLPKVGIYTDNLTHALAPYLADALGRSGYDTQAENLRIDEILSARLVNPKYDDGSQIMTALEMTLKVSGRRLVVPLAQQPDEEVYLLTTLEPISTPEPTPLPTPYYSGFAQLKDPLTITLPLFGALEQSLGLSINSGDNEIITLHETDDSFVIESRRYGHGVGMSQRGAEWMAAHEGMTYQQILDFYYPGTQLKTFNTEVALPNLDPARLATPGPKPTATPRPTLMPVSDTLPQGAWYAYVTEIDDDSSLNLRSEPNTGCDILMRLYKNQKLIVLEECQEEGWLKVKTDAAEGYVMASFLTQEKE